MENLSFGNDDYKLPQSRIFDALGNAVNVEIVRRIAQNLLPDE
jgi:DNA (cytosine-5)-methyltransferase 1